MTAKACDPPWQILAPEDYCALGRCNTRAKSRLVGSKERMGGGTCANTGICIYSSQIFTITIANLR